MKKLIIVFLIIVMLPSCQLGYSYITEIDLSSFFENCEGCAVFYENNLYKV